MRLKRRTSRTTKTNGPEADIGASTQEGCVVPAARAAALPRPLRKTTGRPDGRVVAERVVGRVGRVVARVTITRGLRIASASG